MVLWIFVEIYTLRPVLGDKFGERRKICRLKKYHQRIFDFTWSLKWNKDLHIYHQYIVFLKTKKQTSKQTHIIICIYST